MHLSSTRVTTAGAWHASMYENVTHKVACGCDRVHVNTMVAVSSAKTGTAVFLVMVMWPHIFDTCLVCVQLLCRMSPLFVSVESLSVRGRLQKTGYKQ